MKGGGVDVKSEIPSEWKRILVQSLNNRALALIMTQDIDEAIASLKKALDISPFSTQAAFNYTALLLHRNTINPSPGLSFSAIYSWLRYRKVSVDCSMDYCEELLREAERKRRKIGNRAVHSTLFRVEPSEFQELCLDCAVLKLWISINSNPVYKKTVADINREIQSDSFNQTSR